MKRTKVLILCFVLFFSLQAQDVLKIAVISDIHYLSDSLMDDGAGIQRYEKQSGKNIRDIPALLNSTLAHLESDVSDILLISGDLTKDGELQSHLDLQKRLHKLFVLGTRIFVIPGNHDISVPHPLKYVGEQLLPTKNISPADFSKIYNEFGYSQAFSRDTASLSYAVALNGNTWLIAIDTNRYNEYTAQTISSGRVLPQTENWVVTLLKEAKRKNISVFGMMHHGLTEHFMFQSMFFSDYLVNDWKRLQEVFADNGMKAIFTGHFHANDITEYLSPSGNKIYDIETGSLSSFPFPYRQMVWNGVNLNIRTSNITSLPAKPELARQDSIAKLNFAIDAGRNKIRAKFADMPDSTVNILSGLIGRMYIIHVQGDEKVDEVLRKQFERFSSSTENETGIDFSEFPLDFPPADNNVSLKLK